MSTLISITDDEFVERFKPVENHLDDNASFDGCMFETYGEELAFVRRQDPDLIWTLVDSDDGLAIIEGYHLVNRIGYLIASVPRPPDTQWHIGLEGPADQIETDPSATSAAPHQQQQ